MGGLVKKKKIGWTVGDSWGFFIVHFPALSLVPDRPSSSNPLFAIRFIRFDLALFFGRPCPSLHDRDLFSLFHTVGGVAGPITQPIPMNVVLLYSRAFIFVPAFSILFHLFSLHLSTCTTQSIMQPPVGLPVAHHHKRLLLLVQCLPYTFR